MILIRRLISMTKYEIWVETFRTDHRPEERSNFSLL